MTYSPDGKWLWNGEEWLPAPPGAPAAPTSDATSAPTSSTPTDAPSGDYYGVPRQHDSQPRAHAAGPVRGGWAVAEKARSLPSWLTPGELHPARLAVLAGLTTAAVIAIAVLSGTFEAQGPARMPMSQDQACRDFANEVLGPPPAVSNYGTAASQLESLNANFDHKLAFTSLMTACRADGSGRADATLGYRGAELCALITSASAKASTGGASPADQLERTALADSKARHGC